MEEVQKQITEIKRLVIERPVGSHRLWATKRGHVTRPLDPDADRFCFAGAVMRVTDKQWLGDANRSPAGSLLQNSLAEMGHGSYTAAFMSGQAAAVCDHALEQLSEQKLSDEAVPLPDEAELVLA